MPNVWLLLGGIGSLLVALLHLAIIFVGAPGYRYFGAPQLAVSAAAGSPLPAALTAVLVVVFTAWALYAFTGAGWQGAPWLPRVRLVLLLVSALYTLRGVSLLPELVLLARGDLPAVRMAVFSAVSLTLGILHGVGYRVLVRQGR